MDFPGVSEVLRQLDLFHLAGDVWPLASASIADENSLL